jgi:hypothetical protein
MHRAATDEIKRTEVIRAASVHLNRYSWQKTAQETLGIYEDLIGDHS